MARVVSKTFRLADAANLKFNLEEESPLVVKDVIFQDETREREESRSFPGTTKSNSRTSASSKLYLLYIDHDSPY